MHGDLAYPVTAAAPLKSVVIRYQDSADGEGLLPTVLEESC